VLNDQVGDDARVPAAFLALTRHEYVTLGVAPAIAQLVAATLAANGGFPVPKNTSYEVAPETADHVSVVLAGIPLAPLRGNNKETAASAPVKLFERLLAVKLTEMDGGLNVHPPFDGVITY
jgi:hypothetical protein